ncbi:MAG: hypothetical protein IPL81_11990 [Flavobacteriales bacterium]|nr:hypothetical protein [Flavobacteriales bacterium]
MVSTRVGGIENVVNDGVTGLLSANNDARSFGENLLRLVDDAPLRARLSSAGWAHVGERYHYSRLISDTAELYQRLIA